VNSPEEAINAVLKNKKYKQEGLQGMGYISL
jgi:hypothetical protein